MDNQFAPARVDMGRAGANYGVRSLMMLKQSASRGNTAQVNKRFFTREDAIGFLSIAPLVIPLLVVTIYPLFSVLYHSLTIWDGVNTKFVGLGNFEEIFLSNQFWILLKNNLILLLSVPLQLVVAFIVAVLLYEQVRGWKFFRSVYFLPSILSTVVIGFVFRAFFSYNGGLNTFLNTLGLGTLASDWLSDSTTAMAVIILCLIWTNFGYGVLIFLAGMSLLDPYVYESATIDGAGWFTKVFRITFPMLANVVEFFTVTTVIWTFTGLFGFIFSITNGGPGYDTTPIDYMVYLKAFKAGNNMGYACALAVILLIILIGLSRLQMYMTERSTKWSE